MRHMHHEGGGVHQEVEAVLQADVHQVLHLVPAGRADSRGGDWGWVGLGVRSAAELHSCEGRTPVQCSIPGWAGLRLGV